MAGGVGGTGVAVGVGGTGVAVGVGGTEVVAGAMVALALSPVSASPSQAANASSKISAKAPAYRGKRPCWNLGHIDTFLLDT